MGPGGVRREPGIRRSGSFALLGDSVREYVGKFSTEMSNHINKFDVFIGTVRSADSLMSWAIELPEHIPDCLKEWALKFSTVAWTGPLVLGELKNVKVNVVTLKDNLNFLELYNRAAKLTDWHSMKWQKQAALAIQILQKSIESIFLQPAKWRWQVSQLTELKHVSKNALYTIKDLCVIASSSLNIWAVPSDMQENTEKLQKLSLRLNGKHKKNGNGDIERAEDDFSGLQGIKRAIKKVSLGADLSRALKEYEDRKKIKKTLLVLCEELSLLKNRLDVLEANTNMNVKTERDPLNKQQEAYQILKHKCIRRWCWDKGLNDAPIATPENSSPVYTPVTFAEFPAPAVVMGELDNIRKNHTPLQRIERIVNYRISKTSFDITNREKLCTQLKIGRFFDATKISIVAFALIFSNKLIPKCLGNYPRIQWWVENIAKETFWMDSLLMGSVGLVRHYAGRFETIKLPSPHGVWN